MSGAVMNEGGPWGGGPGGGDADGPRSPWSPRRQPGGGKPGPSALDALIRRGRARFGGGGGGGGSPAGFSFGGIAHWIVIGVFALWIGLTSAHTIGPQQRGVITRLGKYVGTLQPGLGFSLPAPFDIVTKLDVDNIHVIDIDGGGEGTAGQNLMLTGDENIIDLDYSVRWNIRDPELYMFELQDPDGTIREVAESAMREAIARVSLNDAIGPQRSQIEARVARAGAGAARQLSRRCRHPGRRDQAGRSAGRGDGRVQGSVRSPADRAILSQPGARLRHPGDRQGAGRIGRVRPGLRPVQARARGHAPPHVLRDDGEGAGQDRQDDRRGAGRHPLSAGPARAASAGSGQVIWLDMIRRNPLVWGGVALVLLAIGASSIAVVPETKQALILRFGEPVRIVNAYNPRDEFGAPAPACSRAFPSWNRSSGVDKRVLDFDMQRQPVLSTDQLRLEVDAFARYRIVNPVQMYVAAGSERRVSEALKPILGSALRNELGKREFKDLLTPERDVVMGNIRTALARVAAQYGAEIVDVRIKRADLPDGSPLDSAFNRMRTARQQEARSIEAEGRREAQYTMADADAQAAKTYSASFGKDPNFYDFYRAMQSYRATFGTDDDNPRGAASVILSPDNEYLRQFKGPK